MTHAAETLAAFAHGLSPAAIPVIVRERVALHTLDTLGLTPRVIEIEIDTKAIAVRARHSDPPGPLLNRRLMTVPVHLTIRQRSSKFRLVVAILLWKTQLELVSI